MASTIGVLALQGAVSAHRRALIDLGAATLEVRTIAQLEAVDALVLPGGESTTMSMMLERTGLRDPIAKRLADGMPAMGTCAGMILLATKILDGRDDQTWFGAIDVTIRRNAFGRQRESFEAGVDVTGMDVPFPAVFIRAPRVECVGTDVAVMASIDDEPVLCRNDRVVVSSFHPELTDDRRLHAAFLDLVG